MTQFKKEVTTLRVNKLALAVALGLSLGLAGCGDDKSVATSVGVPNPNALMPTGTIQGRLTDTVTNEPIVGAVVDIGVAKATTSETGQFVISNVPATADSATGTVGGAYQVTVDLRQVKVPTNGAKYPDFSYTTAAVNYTSLNDGSNDAAGTSSSNHDTPVTGLVAPINVKVGKLAAGIKGVVANNVTLAPVGAGYTVKLVSLGDVPNENSAVSGKGGTGALENVVATVTTDANGAFSFDKIESLRNFRIDAMSANGAELGQEDVRSPADGQVKTLLIQRAADAPPGPDLRTVFVATTDTLAPRVLKATPENGSEIAPGSNVTVKFAFSEPIKQTAATKGLTPSSAATSLYNLIQVNFLGAKAGNIAHSLSWNAAFTELTVTIPTVAAASNYRVDLRPAVGILSDMQDVAIAFDAARNEGLVDFTTNGAVTPAVVSTLAVTNRATLNAAGAPIVDWLPVSGAKEYNVYRAKSTAGGAFGAYERISTEVNSDYSETVSFVEGGLKVAYKYMVRPVSLDNIESADSTSVVGTDIAQDNWTPAVAGAGITGVAVTSKVVTVIFNEQMDEASAETLANYTLAVTTGANAPATAPALPALVSATYNRVAGVGFPANSVTLVYASNVPAGTTFTVTGVKDVAGNVMTATPVGSTTATNTANAAKVTVVDLAATTNVVDGINYFGGTSATVEFTADMDKADAETIAKYTLTTTTVPPVTTPPTTNAVVTKAVLNGDTVTLTFDKALSATTTLAVAGIKDKFGTVADGVSTKVVGP